jgi:hypothetical protein
VNAAASIDGAGVGGQTPIFHAVTQLSDRGVAVTELLIERGADLSIRARLPVTMNVPSRLWNALLSDMPSGSRMSPTGRTKPKRLPRFEQKAQRSKETPA